MSGTVNLIVAISENGVIGVDGQMPWNLPPDLKYFRATTMNHTVVMGRKCYESIGMPLKGRRNIVLSRQKNLVIDGCEVIKDITEINELEGDVFIIGGAEIYNQLMNYVDNFYVTRILGDYYGDTTLSIDYSKLEVEKIGNVEKYGDISYRFEKYRWDKMSKKKVLREAYMRKTDELNDFKELYCSSSGSWDDDLMIDSSNKAEYETILAELKEISKLYKTQA